jgi:hypothetical protein
MEFKCNLFQMYNTILDNRPTEGGEDVDLQRRPLFTPRISGTQVSYRLGGPFRKNITLGDLKLVIRTFVGVQQKHDLPGAQPAPVSHTMHKAELLL